MLKYLKIFIINSLIGLLIFFYLYFSQSQQLPNLKDNLTLYLVSIILTNILGFVLFFFSKLLNYFLPWSRRTFIRFIVNLIGGMIIIILILYPVLMNIDHFPVDIENQPNFTSLVNGILLRFYILAFLSMLFYLIIDMMLFFYQSHSKIVLQHVRLEKEHIRLQLESLKSQLSPHYLFNSLNTISSLIDTDSNLAESYIRNQSKVNQYILRSSSEKLVTLKEELKVLDNYKFMTKTRHGDAIKLNTDIQESDFKKCIPPLTLQILVENAIKHNSFSEEKPLIIKITTNGKRLTVINTLSKKQKQNESFHIGLNNINRRLELFTNKKMNTSINKNFKVSIPLLVDYVL